MRKKAEACSIFNLCYFAKYFTAGEKRNEGPNVHAEVCLWVNSENLVKSQEFNPFARVRGFNYLNEQTVVCKNDDQNLVKGRIFSENDGLDVPNKIIQKRPIDCCHKMETKQKKVLNRYENLTLSATKRNLSLFFSYFHFGKWMRLGHAVLKKGVAKRSKNVLPE